MRSTPNCGLYLEDMDTTKFKEWREKMNGVTDSNMIKIDNAIGEKADRSVTIHTTLPASAWTGAEPPFTQDLMVDGLTAEQNGDISVSHSATPEQREITRNALLAVTGQSDGKLTIAADGEKPEADIPVTITLVG